MRASRVFRLIVRIFILLLTFSITVVAALGAMSAVLILSNPDNIGIDTDDADFNIDYDLAGLHNANFTLPFNVTNAGYFDLENLELEIDIAMNYSEVDYPTPGVNGTKTVAIFHKSLNFGTIPQGVTRDFIFTGLFSDFIVGNFPNITDIDIFQPPPLFEFYANFTISLDYSLGMHSISVSVTNLQIGEFP
ncbi:MAG: hypothetical protein ACXABO_02550 [Promethearchaeota archaeon]|jgi:hypothetical protein